MRRGTWWAAVLLVCAALGTYVWAATPEAIYRHAGVTLPYTSASADYEGGDVIAYGDRAAIVVGDIDYSVNPVGNIYVAGVFDLTCAATTYWQAGEAVFWDSSANTSIRLPGDDGDFYLGICVLAKTGSGTAVRVALNEHVAQGIEDGDIVLFEDFAGYAYDQYTWQVVDVNDATEAKTSGAHGGIFALTIVATSEAEDAVLYAGDVLDFDLDLLKTFECRAAVTTPGSGVTVVWGMADAHNLDKDTVNANTWFRIDGGSMVCDVETDDNATDDDDNSTGVTLVTGTFYVFKIDFTDSSAVKFFINGVQVPDASTSYDMSGFTTEMQPYFSLDKASGTSTGVLSIDWVRVVSARE